MLGTDGEQGAQIYPFATTFAQAEILFRVAKRMAAQDERLRTKIKDYAKRLVHGPSNSFMEPLHAKSRTQDGLNPHFACADNRRPHALELWPSVSSRTASGACATRAEGSLFVSQFRPIRISHSRSPWMRESNLRQGMD